MRPCFTLEFPSSEMAHSLCGEKLQGREEVGFLGGQKDHKTARWRQGHCKKKIIIKHWNLVLEDSERLEDSRM